MTPVKRTTKKTETKERAVKKTAVDLGSQKNPPQPSLKGGRNAGSPPLGGARGDLQIVIYNQDGKEAGSLSLPSEIFGLKVNSDLVAQAVRAQMANTRENIAHAKDRSEVRGGGKKPWKQKGTGRARHASIRSPLWAGGGVTFGPRKEKNFSVKINKKMKRQALFMVLSGKLNDGELVILSDLKLAQGKTKEMAEVIKNIKTGAKKDLAKGAMIVLAENDEAVVRAARNLPKIYTIGVGSLNVADLLSVKYLVAPKAAIDGIKKVFMKQ